MITKEAIEKAFEGGYRPDIIQSHIDLHDCDGSIPCVAKDHLRVMTEECLVLHPPFWQALMYGTGHDVKEGTMRCKNYNPKYNEPGERGCFADKCEYAGYKDWKDVAISFLDLILQGKDPTPFWKELLSDKDVV